MVLDEKLWCFDLEIDGLLICTIDRKDLTPAVIDDQSLSRYIASMRIKDSVYTRRVTCWMLPLSISEDAAMDTSVGTATAGRRGCKRYSVVVPCVDTV